MRRNPLRRPISLAARLTLTISLATSLAFAVFTWIMIYSVERHFAELDNGTLQQVRSSILRILQEPPRPDVSRQAVSYTHLRAHET